MVINDNRSLNRLLIAEDPLSQSILTIARKAAKSDATILISGETGVGKELIAHYIHQHSHCSEGPYISLNCAALPENMIESILFGYEKGAFTGAVSGYAGKFEQAHNGTLLLDEIAELPLGLQAKLLRVLQERQIERLGGKRLININVRIIAATNKDLLQQVNAGYFRSDLYYRLNVIPLFCEPLRKKQLDILPLTYFFIEKYAKSLNRDIPILTQAAKIKLQTYRWPGNVRELENVIHRALIMNNKEQIDVQDIDIEEVMVDLVEKNAEPFKSPLKANEAKIIMDVLKEAEGSRDIAAKKLNMSPRTLRYKISKLKSIGLKVPK